MLNLGMGCTPIRMEALTNDFDAALAHMLSSWRISAAVQPALVRRLAKADLARKSAAEVRSYT